MSNQSFIKDTDLMFPSAEPSLMNDSSHQFTALDMLETSHFDTNEDNQLNQSHEFHSQVDESVDITNIKDSSPVIVYEMPQFDRFLQESLESHSQHVLEPIKEQLTTLTNEHLSHSLSELSIQYTNYLQYREDVLTEEIAQLQHQVFSWRSENETHILERDEYHQKLDTTKEKLVNTRYSMYSYYKSPYSVSKLFLAWKTMIKEQKMLNKIEIYLINKIEKKVLLRKYFHEMEHDYIQTKHNKVLSELTLKYETISNDMAKKYEEELQNIKLELEKSWHVIDLERQKRKQLEDAMYAMLQKNLTMINEQTNSIFHQIENNSQAENRDSVKALIVNYPNLPSGEVEQGLDKTSGSETPYAVQPSPMHPSQHPYQHLMDAYTSSSSSIQPTTSSEPQIESKTNINHQSYFDRLSDMYRLSVNSSLAGDSSEPAIMRSFSSDPLSSRNNNTSPSSSFKGNLLHANIHTGTTRVISSNPHQDRNQRTSTRGSPPQVHRGVSPANTSSSASRQGKPPSKPSVPTQPLKRLPSSTGQPRVQSTPQGTSPFATAKAGSASTSNLTTPNKPPVIQRHF